jgi:hypothetical protein
VILVDEGDELKGVGSDPLYVDGKVKTKLVRLRREGKQRRRQRTGEHLRRSREDAEHRSPSRTQVIRASLDHLLKTLQDLQKGRMYRQHPDDSG